MIGKNLRYWRKKRNMTLQELEEKSGVPPSALSEMENEKRTHYSEERLLKIAHALDIPVSRLWEDINPE